MGTLCWETFLYIPKKIITSSIFQVCLIALKNVLIFMFCLCLYYVYVLVLGHPKWCCDTRNFEVFELLFCLQVEDLYSETSMALKFFHFF